MRRDVFLLEWRGKITKQNNTQVELIFAAVGGCNSRNYAHRQLLFLQYKALGMLHETQVRVVSPPPDKAPHLLTLAWSPSQTFNVAVVLNRWSGSLVRVVVGEQTGSLSPPFFLEDFFSWIRVFCGILPHPTVVSLSSDALEEGGNRIVLLLSVCWGKFGPWSSLNAGVWFSKSLLGFVELKQLARLQWYAWKCIITIWNSWSKLSGLNRHLSLYQQQRPPSSLKLTGYLHTF